MWHAILKQRNPWKVKKDEQIHFWEFIFVLYVNLISHTLIGKISTWITLKLLRFWFICEVLISLIPFHCAAKSSIVLHSAVVLILPWLLDVQEQNLAYGWPLNFFFYFFIWCVRIVAAIQKQSQKSPEGVPQAWHTDTGQRMEILVFYKE